MLLYCVMVLAKCIIILAKCIIILILLSAFLESIVLYLFLFHERRSVRWVRMDLNLWLRAVLDPKGPSGAMVRDVCQDVLMSIRQERRLCKLLRRGGESVPVREELGMVR